MFQIICQIGPLDIFAYGKIVAAIVALGILALIVIACLGGIKRKALAAVLFWTLALSILAMVPLMTTVTIYSYGLMMAVAVVVCALLLAAEAHRNNIRTDIVFDLVFWSVVGGVVGARLFYVILNYSFFAEHPQEIIKIQNGGLAWQGGLMFGALAAMMFIRAKKISLPQMLDISAPYLALGQAIGRIGCFFNGCCFGKEVAWGIYFPIHSAQLHPTQLYLSGGLLIIFLILKRYQRFSEISGLVFVLYLILASSLRFGVEFFRADHDVFLLGLSIFQFVCFGILIFAFGLAYVMLIKHSLDEND